MRGSWILPGPRPGARLDVAMPFRWVGCGGSGGAGERGRVGGGWVAVMGVEVREEERECFAAEVEDSAVLLLVGFEDVFGAAEEGEGGA